MTDGGTLAAYLDDWLERQATQLQPSTWRSYRGFVSRYLLRDLGSVALAELERPAVEQFYANLFRRGGRQGQRLSRRTVAYTHSILHKALADAVRDGLLATNPCRRAVLPKVDHASDGQVTEIAAWDAGQLRTFVAATTEHRHRDLFVVAAFTGLRRGELCGLRWCDIDLDRQLLHVQRSLTIIDRRVLLKEPKTYRTRRLHIDDTAGAALARQRAWQEQRRAEAGAAWRNELDLVFTAAGGRPLVPDSLTRTFRQAVAGLPLPRIRLHDLRHTHATLMLQAGVPVQVVSQRLGHASVHLTMEIYAHVLPAMDAEAADRFADHILGPDMTACGAAPDRGAIS
ncbi:MAG TPA: tyrosine-type recombinase/integrase [Egibacteraceae bacterium]|nr:tyrosine-type recombinase/integrase [Egibacteraceae bacterium]